MKPKVERGRWVGLACLMLVLHSLTAEAEQPVKAVAAAEPQSVPRFLGTHDSLVSVAHSPDGKTLASAGKTIQLWDVTTGKVRATPGRTHQNP
jgi:WD40 repeat protein